MRFALLLTTLLISILVGLAGADVETSANRQVEQGGYTVVPCDVSAYVIDKDPNGLNVRSGPGRSYSMIGNLAY